MGIKELSIGRSDMFRIDPRIMQEKEGWNVRTPSPELTEHIRALANSIKEVGVKVPLKVKIENEAVYVTAGHCRLAATMLAISEGTDIKSIPVIPEDRGSTEADRVVDIVISNEGKPLTILEQAEAYFRLKSWGWSADQIAKKTGYTETHIKSCVTLRSANPEILSLISSGKVSATLAMKLISEHGEPEALKMLSGAVETAVKAGKKKATEKDTRKTPGAEKKKINYKVWGPKLHHALEAICTCPATGKGSENLGTYLAEGNEVLSLMEDDNEGGKL
jgi:ParB family chromosome partitioning protein